MNLSIDQKNKIPLILGVLAIPLLLLIAYSNLKLIVLTVLVSTYLIYLGLIKRTKLPSFQRLDISWLLFIGVSAMSFLWATDMSMIWFPLTISVTLVLFMFCIRWSNIESFPQFKRYFSYLVIVIFGYYLLQHILAVNFDITIETWNSVLSKNPNYTTSYLLVLYPFFLFYPFKNQFLRFLKFIAAILLLNLLLLTNARGGLLGFAVLLIFYFWSTRSYYNKNLLASIALMIVGLVIVAINYSLESSDSQFLLFYKNELISRWHMIETSLSIWKENPLLGVGAGNWHIEAYGHSLDNVAPFNDSENIIRYRSHNLYTLILAELGIMGLITYCTPFVVTLVSCLKRINTLSYFEKANLGVLMFFLIASYFYGNVNFYKHHFSTIHLLAFFALGVLTSGNSNIKIMKFWIYPIIFLSVLSSLYMVKSKLDCSKYALAKNLILAQPAQAIRYFNELYEPSLNTAFDFQTSYSHQLALLYAQVENLDSSIAMFEKALVENPSNYEALLDYSQFLFHRMKDNKKAKDIALSAVEIQSTSCRLNILLVEIAISENRTNDAKLYINKVEDLGCSENYANQLSVLKRKISN